MIDDRITPFGVKYEMDKTVKLQDDFNYLTNPSKLPIAYEAAIDQVKRRRKLAKDLERKFNEITKRLQMEKKEHVKFKDLYGKVLPISFIPNLLEISINFSQPSLSKELNLPEFEEKSNLSPEKCEFNDNSEF